MTSDGGIQEGLRQKWRQKKRDPKTLKRVQACVWVFCLIIAILYALSEIWIVVTERPVVKIKRALKNHIPMPNLDIAFNYRFNVTCNFKYMNGSLSNEPCSSYIKQPLEKDNYGKYHARMITYNFSTPDVPPLNYSLKEQRYAAQFTIVLDDSSYNATNDLGMFVNAIDTEFDPYTLPDNTRETIEKLDPDFFSYLNSSNKNIIGTYAENFMFIKRKISNRVNPSWISYTGFPAKHFSFPYIETSFETASVPAISSLAANSSFYIGSVYGNLLVGTSDWVVEERKEHRKTTKRHVTNEYGRWPTPFINKADPNQEIIDRINNFERFMRAYLVKTDYIRSRKEIDEEGALLQRNNSTEGDSPTSSTRSVNSGQQPMQPIDDQMHAIPSQTQQKVQKAKTMDNTSAPNPFADPMSGGATQYGKADSKDSSSGKIKRPVEGNNPGDAVPSSGKLVNFIPGAARFGLNKAKQRDSTSPTPSNNPNETANQSPISANDTPIANIPSSDNTSNIKKPTMSEAKKPAAALGAVAGFWGLKNITKKKASETANDNASKIEKPVDDDNLVVIPSPSPGHFAAKKTDKTGRSKQHAPIPGKATSGEKLDNVSKKETTTNSTTIGGTHDLKLGSFDTDVLTSITALTMNEERKQSVSSQTSSVIRGEKYPDRDLIEKHEKFASNAEIFFKESESKRSSQSTTKGSGEKTSTVLDQTIVTIISEETPRNSLFLDAQTAANAELYLEQQASTDQLNVSTSSSSNLLGSIKRDIEVISIKSTNSHITEVVTVTNENMETGGAAQYAEQIMKSYRDHPTIRDSTMTAFSQTSTQADSMQTSSSRPLSELTSPDFRDSILTTISNDTITTVTASSQPKIEVVKYIDQDGNEVDPAEFGDDSEFEILGEETTVELIEQKVASDSENEEWSTPRAH
ncbi:5053_t:CDS:2 [Ambispora gerdemannii]|uniref:5053_t:CDS:1 n=1 Tax=Ambispora gerdemannii TaxID=144530 RepID=A0A9N8WCM3_9GLOM|nr:5053_t:CDS:2 [Ambispora gerdemannii]